MNRTILTVTGVLSASSLLLVDSAVKGTALLALAAVAALMLRRDSAATRHLVWLLAMARTSSLEGRLVAVLGKNLNRRGVSLTLAAIALLVAVVIAVPIAMLRATEEQWNPPRGAHIGTKDFSALCVHDGKDAAFVIAYHGDFGSATESSSNAKTHTWTDSGTLTAKKLGIALGFLRTHTTSEKLVISIAPAEGRDLSKPAPAPREFGQKEYDLAKGRVFLLTDNGSVRQLDVTTPVVTDQESAKKLAALIAAVPPQDREDVALTPNHTGKLAPETIAKLKWGEPVNGLSMALAYPPALGDALIGKKPHFELVVQNVSEKEIHFLASDEAPNPRRMLIREGERIVQGLRDHLEVSPADWKLLPGECGVLRLFATEESNKAGTIPSSAIESDLSKIGRYHAIVRMEIAKAPAGAWTGKLVTGQSRGSADVSDAPAPKHKDARALYEMWQRQFFVENPPTVTDDKGKPVSFGRVTAFGVHGHREVKLMPGKEIELYELKLDLESGNKAGVGVPNFSTIYGTGKFQVQYEKVLGNSSSGSIKLDPALSKLATGKMDLEIKPVAPPPGAAAPNAKLQPATETPGANIVKIPDDQYVKSGVPVGEVKDVVWNETQNGLSLGYRITGDEWRILGRPVDVELWVRNPGAEGRGSHRVFVQRSPRG